MAKFYQHMQPGETLGKITKLKYIDDISDDELTLYVFEDNTKCDESYIAEVNNMNAFNGRYMMTELSGPTNKWSFKTVEFNLNETKTVTGDNGEVYEVPQPGISINGEHMSLSLTDDGKSSSRPISNAGKRTDATPPVTVKTTNIEPKENYLLSLHPELLDPSLKQNTNISESTDNLILGKAVKKPEIKVDSPEVVADVIAKVPNPQIAQYNSKQVNTTKSPISTAVIETVRHASITINLDDILSNSEYDSINIVSNGETVTLSTEQFAKRLCNEVIEQVSEDKKISPYEDPDYKEDILITNMIDKSKKKVYNIGVDIELELPPKEVYKTIKDVYPEGMSEHFVTSISRRMNNNTLKEALAKGLTDYYESTLSDNTKQEG